MRRNRGRRDISIISNRRLPALVDLRVEPISSFFRPRSNYWNYSRREVEDRRQWHPLGYHRPAQSVSSQYHQLRAKVLPRKFVKPRAYGRAETAVAFGRPERLMVCVRRSIRKQVMHATGRAGRGGQKKPRFNWLSQISCKR